MRIATIDVGTNTALLLIAEIETGRMQPLHEERQFVRLGEGVDASGLVTDAALQRLRRTLRAYRDTATAWGAVRVVVGATSASRDARNRADLIAFVKAETGIDYEILSGEEEAVLSFAGALSAFPALAGRCAVIDIGGGSTELVVGPKEALAQEDMVYRRSLNVGSVRIAERFFSTQPPSSSEIKAAEAFVMQALRDAEPPLDPATPLVGAAGTLKVLKIADEGSMDQDPTVETAGLSYDTIRHWRERLLSMTYDEVVTLNPEVMKGRADVFPAAVLILEMVLRKARLERCLVSPRGLRHGLALREARTLTA